MSRVSTAGHGTQEYERYVLGQLPTGLVLNVGAGKGLELPGREIVNLDHVIPVASHRPPTFVVGDALKLPFRDSIFDGALLKDVIEHLHDPIAALAESRRVVRVGGEVTVITPRAIPRAVWADPTHIRGFTADALRKALEMAGWTAGRPARIGGFPGAARLGLVPHLGRIMKVPGFGHWFGTNWIVSARRG